MSLWLAVGRGGTSVALGWVLMLGGQLAIGRSREASAGTTGLLLTCLSSSSSLAQACSQGVGRALGSMEAGKVS